METEWLHRPADGPTRRLRGHQENKQQMDMYNFDKIANSLTICEGGCGKECIFYNSASIDGDTCQNRLCGIAAEAIKKLQTECNQPPTPEEEEECAR